MAPWIRHGLPILALLSVLVPGNSAQGSSSMITCVEDEDCPTRSMCTNGICICGSGNELTLAGPSGCNDSSPKCQELDPIDNGSFNATGLSINDTVEYFCDHGFGIRDGGTTRTCESNGWSGTAPVCENVTEIYNRCSYNSIKCHPQAVCEDDVVANTWECVCNTGLAGDGLLGPENTGCGDISDKHCFSNDECHVEAECSSSKCYCLDGFYGNGWTKCDNINECLTSPCSQHAKCDDEVPGFRCTCLPTYKGDGFNCSHVCNIDEDCDKEGHEECNGEVCVCKDGFERNEAGHCVDVPECTRYSPCGENADCEELIGHYRCTCRNGFAGINGQQCTKLPLDCEQILAESPTATSGKYRIDIDGEGPLTDIMVSCEMKDGRGITLIYPVERYSVKFYRRLLVYNFTYEHSLEHTTALIDRSEYCFQDVSYQCKSGAILMNGDYWLDRNGDRQYNWAGADDDNMCPCGQLGYCPEVGANCNCNAASTEKRYDFGKMTKKDLLPVTQFFSDRTDEPSRSRAYVRIGPVTCAAEHYGLPRSCDDAKFNPAYRIRYDSAQYLDFDGPGGLDPVWAHCNMESFPHVGVTIIPHTVRTRTEVTVPGEHSITYKVNGDAAKMLVNISEYCMQEAEYVCKNSRLLNNGDPKGYFSTLSGEQANYWPGGDGEPNHCGCGRTHMCDQDMLCNCDIMDGQTRTDFGVLTEKRLLPIGAMTFMDVGGADQNGTYYVGPLMCAGQQFGIPRACDGYFYAGMTESYAYLIDPDGPEILHSNIGILPPFHAYCKFVSYPPSVTTIINHYEEINGNSIYYHYYVYEWAQLQALTDWSISCTQAVSYQCQGAPLFVNGQAVTTWQTINGEYRSYFAGDGLVEACLCGMRGTCDGGGACECDMDDSQPRSDVGSLTNKDDLPVFAVHVSDYASEYNLTLGPLECRSMFPTCTEMFLYNKYDRPNTEQALNNEAQFTVDPDGFEADGVEPFVVTCSGSETTITIVTEPPNEVNSDPDNATTQCFPVTYKDPNGIEITPKQIVKLIKKSKRCAQKLTKKCLDAPITNRTFYRTCDGEKQTAWGGSRTDGMCSCGATGTCSGGSDVVCNCDNENGEWSEDSGFIVDDDRVGVCETCVTLDPASGNNGEPDIRKAVIILGDLVCDRKLPGGSGSSSCQEERNSGNTVSGPINIDPDGAGPAEPAPYPCVFKPFPPVAWMEVGPKNPTEDLPTTKITIEIKYWTYSLLFLRKVIERSSHCEQEIWLDCVNSSLTFMDDEGLYSYDGSKLPYWAGNSAGHTSCAGGTCNCNSAGAQSDGGKITDKDLLPISMAILGGAPGQRKLRISPVVCYNLPRDCHEIREKRLWVDPLQNGTYAIDPDQEGPLGYFPAECDFRTNRHMGISIIKVISPPNYLHPIKNQQSPGEYQRTIEYDSATYEQIHALSEISGFCQQIISYKCRGTPLIGSDGTLFGFYNGYDGLPSTSFGHSDMVGCGCLKTASCPPDSVCHCNGGPQVAWDYGFLMAGGPMPISQVNFGGQNASNSVSTYHITDVRCGPWPFDVPRDCHEARARGFSSGEILIQPDNDVEPFLVYCEMRGEIGITIIGNNHEGKTPVTYGSEYFVEYNNANEKQVDALVWISKHCHQPFSYDCFDTRFFVGENYFWQGGTTTDHEQFVGDGKPYARECNCGRQGLCGGSEPKATLLQLKRSCNCDSADSKWRRDAGIYSLTHLLPIKQMEFTDTNRPNAMGFITLGKLYCSQKPIDLNPCEMGFFDCNEHATCRFDKRVSYKCRCKHGWNGLGTDKWANGRDCYDDDDCVLNRCSPGSICTNLAGSYNCTCLPGFTKTSPTRCDDIDECATSSPCDQNAKCHNRVGSFACRCNWGYRGDGFTCYPVAECKCFGDPHCMGFDRKLLHYQGECSYTMTRDACDDLSQTPTFEVIGTFHKRDVPMRGRVSWVKEVLVKYMGHDIRLLQHHEIRVDGVKVNAYITSDVEVRKIGKFVVVVTAIGMRVYWDGNQEVKVEVPVDWQNQTCGLCGNYNGDPDDDFTIGPACPANMGNITNNGNLFGNSWMTDVATEAAEGNGTCAVDCGEPPETDECLTMSKHQALFYCKIIWGIHSDFSDTLSTIEYWVREIYLESCAYDMCRLGGDITDVLCGSVEAIAQQCEASSQDALNAFLDDNNCRKPCGDNMEYVMCKSQTEMTCFDYLNGNTPSAPEPGTTSEGCYCLPGFYLDVDSCVREEDCGCIHDNTYYPVGGQVVLNGCSSYAVCGDDHQMDTSGIVCHINATCRNKDGVYGCHCNEGMFGDGVQHCYTDPCEHDVCGVVETCIRLPENNPNYECMCSVGYMGDCGACQEIDECKTGTNNCPYHSECINTIGSFVCKCLDGFMMDAGKCVDIDECAIDKLRGEGEPGICVENARCSNKIGGHKCVCCQGYEWNDIDNKTDCVASASTEQPEQPKCCICDIELCKRPGMVCGEDGIEYNNMRDMIIHKCEEERNPGQMYNVGYFGPCQQTCEPNPCPRHQVCSMQNDRPTCDCDTECPPEDIQAGKVCDENHITWLNVCIFKQAMCRTDTETKLLPTTKPCDDKNGRSKFGEWSSLGPCSVTCGKGTKTRTRVVFGDWTPTQRAQFKLTDSEDCYEPPCEDGPCFEFVCENEAAECVVNGGTPECECPMCNEDVEDPICGFTTHPSSGIKKALWQSPCILQRYACINGLEDYENMYPGHCIDEPLNCARVPHSSEIIYSTNNTNCNSRVKVNKYECDGGCKRMKSKCCEPTSEEIREVPMYCGDDELPSFTELVAIIRKCKCT